MVPLTLSSVERMPNSNLNYQSICLLLTQVEVVYEEEDWKRGGGGSGSGTDLHVVQLVEDQALHEEGDDALADVNVNAGWKQLLGNTWRMTHAIVIVTGKSYRC